MAEPPTTDNPEHQVAPVAISDGHASANGGTLQGLSPPPAAGLPLGGRVSTDDTSGSALRLQEEDAEATTLALTEPAAVVADGCSPAEGSSPEGTGLALVANPAPGECLSEAPYRLLHHRTAVSFVPSDISVFFTRHRRRRPVAVFCCCGGAVAARRPRRPRVRGGGCKGKRRANSVLAMAVYNHRQWHWHLPQRRG